MEVDNVLSSPPPPPPPLKPLMVLGGTDFQLRHIDVVRDTECGVRSAECGVRSADCTEQAPTAGRVRLLAETGTDM
ncbi:unnamed protein product [Taenia asiatica]|uniref:Uncharacterized protein n=1 Tax=Taenia asiatica TaxID=60517 RepID=A0A0R3WBA0_TAEAS|nr:unnamed protein product [Taenia asiatica]